MRACVEVLAPVRGGTRPRAGRGARACGKACARVRGARARKSTSAGGEVGALGRRFARECR